MWWVIVFLGGMVVGAIALMALVAPALQLLGIALSAVFQPFNGHDASDGGKEGGG